MDGTDSNTAQKTTSKQLLDFFQLDGHAGRYDLRAMVASYLM